MITVEGLVVTAGDFRLQEIALEIPTSAYGVLMGRTGCGKTTLLEAICGLKRVDAGRILLHGRDITRLRPAERGIGYVPQDCALFETITIYEHLAFALRLRRWKRARIQGRVQELAQLLGITHLLQRRPHGLSGGETQRVALGRALSFHPRVLCLDEPLSALDHDTRLEMCGLLESLKQRLGVTVLHVTHNRAEAARLADRLFVFSEGRIERACIPPVEAGLSEETL